MLSRLMVGARLSLFMGITPVACAFLLGSLIGIVALGGVVVNSSLVLVDYINGEVADGHTLQEAVANAGVARFRPIFLTSMTTFIGLVPLMATPTPATFFIVPMAISLAFGVLFATVITLFLVPSLYLILYDFTTHREHVEDLSRTPTSTAA
jgi:multidrug efflux pump subunit AcrB